MRGMLRCVTVYRSGPAQLARAAMVFFALVLVGVATYGVDQAIAHGTYVPFSVVYCIVVVGFLVLARRIVACRLVATSTGLEIVNWFATHTVPWTDVACVMSGDERPKDLPLSAFADDRHVLVKTTEGRFINVAALTLGPTPWGVRAVHEIVVKLNTELAARRAALADA